MAHRPLQLLANDPAQRLNPGRWERRRSGGHEK
jgi:hypothetical protein